MSNSHRFLSLDAAPPPAGMMGARNVPVEDADVMRLAEAFYRVHAESGATHVAAYHPDTPGVFDIARCILRPLAYPQTRQECVNRKELWHDLTL